MGEFQLYHFMRETERQNTESLCRSSAASMSNAHQGLRALHSPDADKSAPALMLRASGLIPAFGGCLE
ncbi:hypothetical protein VN97_g5884 [Penicillium thymicola]|uniref:Uncharacterized protein n=1 Tax=Penicillium thymicola TaxID=293382 RepID=A0AAI9THX8_PENTH|nr:hypothetical protein VN97_g5884 [Penicillium thymicola]